MATYVLIHGGGHGGWCWEPVCELLRAAGHAVHAPTLTGLAERLGEARPGIGLETHVAEVAALIATLAPQRVVLAGHSYGGVVISGAAARVAGQVAWLAYIDAAMVEAGEALIDTAPALAALAEDVVEVDGVPYGLWPDERALAIYGLKGALAEAALAQLTPHPWACFTEPLRVADPAALAVIPRALLNCTGSLARRPEHLRYRWQRGNRIAEIDAPHDVMLTHPDAVAAFLLTLASPGG